VSKSQERKHKKNASPKLKKARKVIDIDTSIVNLEVKQMKNEEVPMQEVSASKTSPPQIKDTYPLA